MHIIVQCETGSPSLYPKEVEKQKTRQRYEESNNTRTPDVKKFDPSKKDRPRREKSEGRREARYSPNPREVRQGLECKRPSAPSKNIPLQAIAMLAQALNTHRNQPKVGN